MPSLKSNELEEYLDSDNRGYDKDLDKDQKKKISTIYKRQSRRKDKEEL